MIPCFITTIAKAASKCFANAKAEDIFVRAINFFNEYSRFIPDVTDPPKINKNFWMTKMNFFEFIADFLEKNSERIDADTTELINDIKTLIECLAPLKVSIDKIIVYVNESFLLLICSSLLKQSLWNSSHYPPLFVP